MVYYEHQVPEEPFWVAKDSIELALSSQPAPDVRHILPIVISYYAAHSNVSSQLWKNKGNSLLSSSVTHLPQSEILGRVQAQVRTLTSYTRIDLMSVFVDLYYSKEQNCRMTSKIAGVRCFILCY